MKWFIASLLLFWGPVLCNGQYTFRHYGNEEGLLNNTVVCMLQDANGFMWFGTKEGLNRFDGIRFVYLRPSPSDSIPAMNPAIQAIEEDSKGQLWMGTDVGIVWYLPVEGRFVQPPFYRKRDSGVEDKEERVPGEGVLQGVLMSEKEGVAEIRRDARNQIWFLTRSGIFRYSETTQQLDHFPANQYFVPTSICVTPAGEVWFSSANGNIYHYNAQTNQFKGYPVLTESERAMSVLFFRVKAGSDNQFLLLTDKAGVKRFNPDSGEVTTLFTHDAEGSPVLPNDLLVTGGEIWVASESGVHLYIPQQGLVQQLTNRPADRYSLSNNAVKCVTQDSEGGIWFGTYYGGLNYLPRERTPFRKYYDTGIPGSLQGNVVKAICRDAKGRLWIGTEDAGLQQFNPATQQFRDFTPKNIEAGVLSTNIQAIQLQGNHLWIATYDNGIFRFDPERERVSRHFSAQNPQSGLRSNYIYTFLATREGGLYAGTAAGLFRYDEEGARFRFVRQLPPAIRAQALHEDRQGNIWMGTQQQGLLIFSPATGSVRQFPHAKQNPKSPGSNSITAIFEDSKNRIWCTTEGNGFSLFNETDSSFVQFNNSRGIEPGITCGMSEDGMGQLWISSSNGLIRLNPETGQSTIFRKINGLPGNHFSYNASFRDNSGRLYFGTVNGMVAFDPTSFGPEPEPSQLFITGFRTENSEKESSGLISQPGRSILYSQQVTLSHRQSSFSIDFASPGFSNPAMVKYRYKLVGADPDWNELSTNRRAYYTNIPPGKYRFVVTTVGSRAEHPEKRAELAILITPPTWRSKGALAGYFVLLTSVLLLFFRIYWRKQQLETAQRIERMERAKERELLEAKLDFFTHITHEVRTPLTLIKAPLDRLLEGNVAPGGITAHLTLMKRNTDRLLELIHQLLDFRKVESSQLQLNYTLINAGRFLEGLCARFLPAAKEQNLQLHLTLPEQPVWVRADKESLTKMVSNLLSNGLKYSLSSIEASVTVQPGEGDKNWVCFRITSNGLPIPAHFREKIFAPFVVLNDGERSALQKGTGLGLSLARSLAELHQGRLYLDPNAAPLNGFVLELPAETDTNKQPQPDVAEESLAPRVVCDSHEKGMDPTGPVLLVVEDEPEMRDFLIDELGRHYKVYGASNGKEALRSVKEFSINLIISDILMPEFDGYQLCKAIKETLDFCHIPVILLTASTGLNAQIEGLECGADAYLEKPFSTRLLLAQIENLFRNKESASRHFMHSPFAHYKTLASNKMDEDFMKQLNAAIQQAMDDPKFSVEMLAGTMGMSLSSLYRKVKALTNLNTNEYIRLFRLKNAAGMLASGQYRVNEVSYLVGFASPSYFSTSFQKQFGLSPSQFLKQQLGADEPK